MPRIKDGFAMLGGSWNNDNSINFHSHYRYGYNPDYRDDERGFRCVSPESSKASKRFVRIMEAPNGS